MSIYTDNGYDNREDYLDTIADEYDFDTEEVYALASILGENEDFDGLVTSLEDFEYFGW